MEMYTRKIAALALLFVGTLLACSSPARKSVDVSDNIRGSLDQAGLKDVTVKEDTDKGVVTLGGQVGSDEDKSRAEIIAQSNAAGLVVANEIAVLPPNDKGDAKTVNSDLDEGIKKNLDAALTQSHLKKDVKHDVKNGVVTLTGNVNSHATRELAESVADSVPNVRQVVNEIEVKHQKASSSK